MEFLVYFLFVISGIYLSLKPLMSIVLVALAIFFLRKKYSKRVIIVSATLFMISFILVLLTKINIFNDSSIGIVTVSKDNYLIVKSGFSSYYIKNNNNTFEVFDILKIEGTLKDYKFSSLESSFNFNDYLKNNLIYKEIEITNIDSIFLTPFRIRSIINNNLSYYDENAKNIIGKLLFNISSSDIYNDLISSNSLFYLLSISSLHIHFLNMIIYKLLSIKFKDKICDSVLIILTLFIFMFSNYKMAILKLLIFYIVNFINTYKLKNKLDYISRISLVGIIIILIKPGYSFSNGFIYSFSLPYYLYLCRVIINMYNKRYQKYIRLLLIFLFITPINIYQNYSLSILSFPFTLIFTPIILFIYLLGVLGLFIPLYSINNYLSRFIYNSLLSFNKINIVINVGEVSIIFIIICFMLLFFLLIAFESKRKKMQLYLFTSLISLVLVSSLPIKNTFTKEVSFINVGQGDSILIRDRNINILVDTGGNKNIDIAKESLIPYFKKKRIRKLDYVFITHDDFDHNGALSSLKEEIKILDINKNNNFNYIKIGNIDFYNLNKSKNNEENIDSLVLYFILNNKYYLLMGDADIKVEEKIMLNYDALKVDYLKIGHHGSKTSTSEKFIKFINPKEAIISCGLNNYYGHPHKEVIDTLNKYNIKIRRTDLEGTITYK